MITGTVALTQTGGTELLLGPVDAPYDVVVSLLYSHDGSGVALAGASFTLTADPANGGDWYVLKNATFASLVSRDRKLRLQEGDSLYAATWDSGAGAVVSFIANPAC